MKTTRIVSVLLVFLLSHTATAVIIQELYPDPINTDTGGEAILLFNEQDSAIDISGWTVGTPSAATDATIPSNTTLSSHGLYLITDTGWSINKDDLGWAAAHREEAITLVNGGGTVVLRDKNGTIIDSIDYPDTTQGTAYWRKGDALIATDPLFSDPLDTLYLSPHSR